ncbi:MAG: ABC transporter ATP-binding protein [Anaerolineales bacterium]|nr:ABC transporter ATP-binding protein [Anaerolineales bacterium]
MADKLIQVENLSKLYRIRPSVGLGWWQNRGVLADDIARVVNRFSGKPVKEKKVDFWALKDVSFEAREGDVIGIIGRNGAGKSTMLKILGRVTEPTSGRAVVYGRVGSLLEVGTGFHSELTGRENIFTSGAILGMPRAEIRKKFDEIVAFSGVEEFLETPVKRFSSGMEVRLAFSIAVHLKPNVLLVDEVLSVGDASFREKSIQKIRDVSNDGGTILFVSHNMTTVASLCNKALVLEHGTVTFPVGSVQSAIEHYISGVREGVVDNLRAGRKGAKPQGIEVTNFGIYDDSGVLLETLTSGMPVNFRIEYKKQQLHSEKPIEFEILLKTLNGEVVARMCNSLRVGNGMDMGSSGKLTCHVEKLPLASGTISVTIMVHQDHHVLDKIEDALIVRIETFGGVLQETWDASHGAWVVIDQTWQNEVIKD